MDVLKKRTQWRTDGVGFAVERLGIRRETIEWSLLNEYKDHAWDGDRDPLLRVFKSLESSRNVAVESATGTGKTFLGAVITLWFLECFEPSIVITIAPKEDQLRLHLWKELQRLWPKFNRGELAMLRLRMQPGSENHEAVGFVAGVSADEVSMSARRAQGFHAEHMLFIVEETPGVHDAVMSAIRNTCTSPHNLILAFGNPDNQSDTLHRFAQEQGVDLIRISAFDHPNIVLNDPSFVPGAQSKQRLDEMLARYGADHRMYQSRARGISPSEAVDSLIRWDWCKDATLRPAVEGWPCIGVDVANSMDGDKAAIAYGEGSRLVSIEDFACPNANELGERVHVLAVQKGAPNECIGVDGIGVGAGTVNELHRLGREVQNLIGSERQAEIYTEHGFRMAEKFKDLRSQMWWLMRLDLQFGAESHVSLPMDEELFADLCSVKYETKNGMIVVEPKEKQKKRLGRSPNKGDAVVYWNWTRKRRSVASTSDDVVAVETRASFADSLAGVRARVTGERRRVW
jgi:hypothetical protein